MFDSDRYEVRQKLGFGDRYNIYVDGADEPFLTSAQKRFRLREDFRFDDAETGEEAFRVTADSVLDVAAAYDIVDSRSGERVGSVKREVVSFLKHEYALLDADGNAVATVTEDSLLKAVLRRKVTTFIPFSYDIVAPDGSTLGSIDEAFSLRDTYTVDLSAADGALDPRLAVIAAVVIDAIEEN